MMVGGLLCSDWLRCAPRAKMQAQPGALGARLLSAVMVGLKSSGGLGAGRHAGRFARGLTVRVNLFPRQLFAVSFDKVNQVVAD